MLSCALRRRDVVGVATKFLRPLSGSPVVRATDVTDSETDTELPTSTPKASQLTAPPPSETFASLLRNCLFTQMGDPVGKVVIGYVYHTVNDDLYIDFGGKFPVVCQRPRQFRDRYVRGSRVRILLKSMELCETFLGYEGKYITLMEADGVLIGLDQNDRVGRRSLAGRRSLQ